MLSTDIDNEIERKARILWSYTKLRSKKKFYTIKKILGNHYFSHNTNVQLELDEIQKGLFHFYEYLNIPEENDYFSPSNLMAVGIIILKNLP